jgi:hypothetical protein
MAHSSEGVRVVGDSLAGGFARKGPRRERSSELLGGKMKSPSAQSPVKVKAAAVVLGISFQQQSVAQKE